MCWSVCWCRRHQCSVLSSSSSSSSCWTQLDDVCGPFICRLTTTTQNARSHSGHTSVPSLDLLIGTGWNSAVGTFLRRAPSVPASDHPPSSAAPHTTRRRPTQNAPAHLVSGLGRIVHVRMRETRRHFRAPLIRTWRTLSEADRNEYLFSANGRRRRATIWLR